MGRTDLKRAEQLAKCRYLGARSTQEGTRAKAEREGDLRAALMAIRELARAFELQGRLVGAFQQDTTGNQMLKLGLFLLPKPRRIDRQTATSPTCIGD